ncbi:LysR family transcriptional regulator [Sphingomonas sp.]|uniref:LysR family transcriptional regulator n=1 Tax=Sphingomonas sp. TaxID=28214 RepID=UPI003D6CE836
MRTLDGIIVFTRVADLGSFTAASRALRLPLATVSRRVADLEDSLGMRLFHRTTRKLALTDIGRHYYDHGRRIVEELEAAEAQVARARAAPSGTIRITAPALFARHRLAPILADFLIAYPDMRCSLHASDRVVDLAEHGFDLAVRGGDLPDSSFTARRVGRIVSGLYASPAMAAALGGDFDIDRLSTVPLIDVRTAALAPRNWRFTPNGGRRAAPCEVAVVPRHEVNDAETVAELAMRGLGIGPLPTFVGEPLCRRGALIRLLPDWDAGETMVSAIYPSHRGVTPAVRILVDLFAERLADD